MALSKTQTKRLGSLLSVTFQSELPEPISQELAKDGFVQLSDEGIKLSAKGEDERKRLTTLAGLNITYNKKEESNT